MANTQTTLPAQFTGPTLVISDRIKELKAKLAAEKK